jgi:ATP-binding cassette subfamily F protein 3
MAAIAIRGITKQFGTQVVLNEVSLDIQPGETVGLVGPNGAGKTTLFRLIVGETPPDSGTVTRARSMEIGYLKQDPELRSDRSLRDEVAGAFDDLLAMEHRLHALSDEIAARHDDPTLPELMKGYERVNQRFIAAGGYTFEQSLHEILGGLGFAPADYDRPVAILSGGEKCRVSLARLLLQDRDILLLDEPTNHLDIDAVRWLEKFLAAHRGGVVIISHDRYLLDRVCDRIVEVDRRRATSYTGNYSTYVRTKEVDQLTQERRYDKDKAFIEKERDFIARHLAGQRTNEAKGRRTRLERRLGDGEFVTERPTQRRSVRLSFAQGATRRGALGPIVLRCDDLAMRFGERELFAGLGFQVREGQRLGITGPNGTGKSTLLRIVLGHMTPFRGKAELDVARSVGYYAQEETEAASRRTVLEEIRNHKPEMSEQAARSYLATFLFVGDSVFKPMQALSGGERSRVRLAKLILDRPGILILDEPTNHLDIPSREVLEDALLDFEGTVIAVSHDRYFLDRAVERLLVIRPEGCTLHEGNYSSYIQSLEAPAATPGSSGTTGRARAAARKSPGKKGKPRKAPPRDEPRRTASNHDRLTVEELEEMIIERETRLAELHEKFGDPAICRDPDALEELQEDMDALSGEIAELGRAWEERADAV